jgi:hypothetical protein
MEQEPLLASTRRQVALLLAQLEPAPRAEWATGEADRIMEQFGGAPPPIS